MPVGNTPGWKQVFKDDFVGTTLSTARWDSYQGIVGGGQGGWWARSHAVVQNGELVLSTSSDPAACGDPTACALFNNEVSGGVKSTFSELYGKFLVRARMTATPNIAFLGILWPQSNLAPPETDFFQIGGSYLTTVGATVKFNETAGATGPTGTSTPAPGEGTISSMVTINPADWHTYGVVWSPGKVVFTIDGRVWAEETNAVVSSVPMGIVLQAESDCQSMPANQACTQPWEPTEPSADIDWVVAYKAT